MGDIEKYGSGIVRTRQLTRNYQPNIDFNLEEVSGFFRAKLSISPSISPAKEGEEVLTTELEKKILESMRQNPHLTFASIGQQLQISHHTVKEYVKRLKDKGIIKRIGSNRQGHWQILDRTRYN